MVYTHWKTYPSRVVTLSTSVTVTLFSACSVLKRVHCQPRECSGKELTVLHCPIVYPGSERISSCLQMRVSSSERSPWSSRETLRAATYEMEQIENTVSNAYA